MYRILISLIVGLFPLFTMGNEPIDCVLLFDDVDMPVYEAPFSIAQPETVIDTIRQDSVTNTYYIAEIIDRSPLRFKIKYIHHMDFDGTPKKGWIDKKYIGLYTMNFPLEVKVYQSPDESTSFEVYNILKFRQTYLLLDIHGDFRKVMFKYEGKNVVGWINDFCANLYGTCNH